MRTALLGVSLVLLLACTTRTTTVTVVPMLPNATVRVPKVIGLGSRAAKHAIESHALIERVKVVSGGYRHARVVRQWPKSGTDVPPGTTVRVVIGPA